MSPLYRKGKQTENLNYNRAKTMSNCALMSQTKHLEEH